MELCNYLPLQAFVFTPAFHRDREIARWGEQKRREGRAIERYVRCDHHLVQRVCGAKSRTRIHVDRANIL